MIQTAQQVKRAVPCHTPLLTMLSFQLLVVLYSNQTRPLFVEVFRPEDLYPDILRHLVPELLEISSNLGYDTLVISKLKIFRIQEQIDS